MALSRKPIEIVDQGNHQLLTKASHWERVPLSDVAIVQNGYAFKSELFTHSEGKPLIRIRDIEDGWTENFYSGEYSDDFVVRKGDILIGMDGDFNATIWQGVDGLLNQRVCRLISTSKDFSDKFLFLCLQPYLNAINAETSSVTVKHLSSKTIGEIPLPLPPKNEQHRIVAKIEELFSELDKGIENLKTVQAQLKVYRQALLKHAFEGKLTAQWRAENQDKLETADALLKRIQQERTQRYQQQLADWEANGGSKPKAPKSLPPLTAEELTGLPELPRGWKWIKLDSIGELYCGQSPSVSEVNTEGKGMLYVTGPEQWNGRNIEEIKWTLFPKRIVPDGCIFITVKGAGVGKLFPGVHCAIGRDIYAFEPEKVVNVGYVINALKHGIDLVIMKAQGDIPGLSKDHILDHVIGLPSIREQDQIQLELEDRFSIIANLDNTIVESLQQAEALRQSILKKALSGQLVPQDPHDEPASALLARIKAQKAEMTIPKRKSK